jgi:hypothetical protein
MDIALHLVRLCVSVVMLPVLQAEFERKESTAGTGLTCWLGNFAGVFPIVWK